MNHQSNSPSISRDEGFTLLEILIVVTIIGLLMAVIGTQLIGKRGEAVHSLARVQIGTLEQALASYELDNGRYPTTEQGLMALVREPTTEPRPRRYQPGGYVKRDKIDDPWGSEFNYDMPGINNTHSFDLYTYAADGVQGGEGVNADLGNWYTGEDE